MTPRLWQAIAVTIGLVLFAFVVADSLSGLIANSQLGFKAVPDRTQTGFIVERIRDPRAIEGALHPGDRINLADRSFGNQMRFLRARRGDRFAFTGTTSAGAPVNVVATMVPAGPSAPAEWVYELLRIALLFVGTVVAVRRPADPLARSMVAFFFALTALIQIGSAFYPVWLVGVQFLISRVCQIAVVWSALSLAVTFPRPSERGPRRWLQRANTPFALFCLATLFSSLVVVMVQHRPVPEPLHAIGLIATVAYVAAIIVGFALGGRGVTGADRKRVQWVGWTVALGFSGTLVGVAMLALHVPLGPAYEWLGVTLLAIPFGIGYAIVRHRVVDIGFVVNRALVFAGVSGVVVVAFGVLEWTLSNVFVRVSHITSTSLELALALGLGFSLRSIHARVDRIVDDLFFRDRHVAERALRTFAREVGYITQPRVAVARAHAELERHTGTTGAAIYVVDTSGAVRVDPGAAAAPALLDADDAALVRLRATRAPLALRDVDTALVAEYAFPMLVRDGVTGIVALGPKTNGEAYAPDELSTIEAVAIALGNALDALHTAALKADLARVLVDGASLETLRGTVDSAAWLRGVAPQPAGSLPGLGE